MKKNDDTYSNLLVHIQSKILKQKHFLHGLGVFFWENSIYLYYQSKDIHGKYFNLAKSANGFDFELVGKNLSIAEDYTSKDTTVEYHDFHLVKAAKDFLLTYKKKVGRKYVTALASSKDLAKFFYQGVLGVEDVGIIVPSFTYRKQYVMYWGEAEIRLAYSKNMISWKTNKQVVLVPRKDYFDSGIIEVEYVMQAENGILVLYHSKIIQEATVHFKVGAALFDKDNPSKLLWRSDEPVWETTSEWGKKTVMPVGVIRHGGRIISYWQLEGEGIFAVIYSHYQLGDGLRTKNISLRLKKVEHNPILGPKAENAWEAFNTFNPAAIYEGGKVHIVYRAQGYNYISVLGYASSSDGLHIDERHDEPAYLPTEKFEYTGNIKPKSIAHMYMSGGGFGGCEDPRLVRIGDKVYMTYVAFDGMSPPRVALTSISLDDFLNHRWLWERPVLISPPGVVDKNAVIFPEKINGKYVIIHRIYPHILLDYVDDLNFDGTFWLKGEYKISPRKDMWDSRKIGAGPPPIKTKDGWLLIYQSVGNQDPGRYKIGAMLLDLKDPTKVLYRSHSPILEPTERYENEGFKSGVAYPCGAVVIRDTLYVYYGGADSVVCVARANLNQFLAELKYSQITKLQPTIIRHVMSA